MYYLGIAYYLFQESFGPRYWLGDAAGISFTNVLRISLFYMASIPTGFPV
jgi:hypothetical protein